jgi:glycosyltransferase involved in cell wall biosynthesis
LIVVDLGSKDASLEIAKNFGAKVIQHEWVPYVELVWPVALSVARNDWLVRADPDEVFAFPLIDDLFLMISRSEKLAMIKLPHQYYFQQRPIKTTIWGGIKEIAKVFHKDRVVFRPLVHRGISCKDGYTMKSVKANPQNVIKHHWADSLSQLFEKHFRYIAHEGKSKYRLGERFSLFKCAIDTMVALKQNLFDYKGIHGGLLGIFLSTFYSWYVCMSWISLRRYQKTLDGLDQRININGKDIC